MPIAYAAMPEYTENDVLEAQRVERVRVVEQRNADFTTTFAGMGLGGFAGSMGTLLLYAAGGCLCLPVEGLLVGWSVGTFIGGGLSLYYAVRKPVKNSCYSNV